MKEKLILIGGGGHCKACIDVIELAGYYEVVGILDIKEKVGTEIFKYPIIGTDEDIERFSKTCRNFHITIGQLGSPRKRKEIFNLLKNLRVSLPVMVSPIAYVSKYAKIGEGTIIMHHALVNAGAVIGCNCIINSKALIEHDAIVHDHCHVATGVIINGNSKIGYDSFIGSGSILIQNIKTSSNIYLGAGSLVINDLSEPGTYVGVPVKIKPIYH
ncbi:MAG: acetyltransferase [Bacteroidales bacterium]|nr:acetyltransferase [Bacteroidales bacterium]